MKKNQPNNLFISFITRLLYLPVHAPFYYFVRNLIFPNLTNHISLCLNLYKMSGQGIKKVSPYQTSTFSVVPFNDQVNSLPTVLESYLYLGKLLFF